MERQKLYIHATTSTLRNSEDSKGNESWRLHKPHYRFPEQLCAQSSVALQWKLGVEMTKRATLLFTPLHILTSIRSEAARHGRGLRGLIKGIVEGPKEELQRGTGEVCWDILGNTHVIFIRFNGDGGN